MTDKKSERKYANIVASIALVFFFLFLIWREDANFIITLALENLTYISDRFYGFTPKLFLIITIYIVFRIISFLFIDVIVKRLHDFYRDQHDFSAISRLMKFGVWGIFAFFALTIIFENNFGSIVTSLGLVGFGITFALQKPILNFVGWLTISFKSIYKPGDRVRIGQARGDVKEINMMNTVLDSLLEQADIRSGKIITIPNESVLSGEVENYTQQTNYIVNDLAISVTYESDYARAQKLLYDIALKVTRENKKKLKKQLLDETQSVEQTILSLGEELVTSPWRRKRKIEQEMKKLEQEEQNLKDQAEELEEEFRPKVRVELKDSAIELVCFFITPYDQIKANRTLITLQFLDACKTERKIEIAYPHMELVFNETAKRIRK